MHAPSAGDLTSFDYAVIRVVPRVERAEFINAGLILFCLSRKFLSARIELNERRLRALWKDIDISLVRDHLEAFPGICAGDAGAGPIAHLPLRERFHWLVAPRSTIIQLSPVHTGLCTSPDEALDSLFQRFAGGS